MTLTVETGEIVDNANSYVDEDDLTTFAAARGITLTGDEEQLLIQAMDYIESLSYIGQKKTATQALQWPRINVIIDGYAVDSSTIPNELKNGQMQTALSIDAGISPQQTISKDIRRKKVDGLEIEYAPGSVNNTIDTKINSFLRKLLTSGSGGNVIKVSKA